MMWFKPSFDGSLFNSEVQPLRDWPGYMVGKDGSVYNRKGRLLSLIIDKRPGKTRCRVELWRNGTNFRPSVHSLILETFVGPRPKGKREIRHLDGNGLNNRLENIIYGTTQENTHDQVRHGTHAYARRSRCKNDHIYTEDTTRVTFERKPNGQIVKRRRCLICLQNNSKRQKTRQQKEQAMELLRETDEQLYRIKQARRRKRLAIKRIRAIDERLTLLETG